MKAFALTWDGATISNLMVATCQDLDDAKKAVEAGRANAGIAVASSEDLNLSGPLLAVMYNKLLDLAVEGDNSDDHVMRFTTRGDGQRRVFGLLELHFKNAPEAAALPTVDTDAARSETETNEEDMAAKGKKTKKAATPKKVREPKVEKVREPKAPKPKKDRSYKDKVVSKGGERAKASALELISRKMGATAQEIADKLELSLGSAKNLVWYLRRDGKKIVVNKDIERKPYVIA